MISRGRVNGQNCRQHTHRTGLRFVRRCCVLPVLGALLFSATPRLAGGQTIDPPSPVITEQSNPQSTTPRTRPPETRKAWIVGAGGGIGFDRRSVTVGNSSTIARDLMIAFDTYVGRGITDRLVITATLGNRLGLAPGLFLGVVESVDVTTLTLAANYYPSKSDGFFLTIGGGYSRITYQFDTGGFLFSTGRTREETGTGYVVLGNIGYEWRVDETFALDLIFNVERHEFDETIFDPLWTVLVGLQLRLYL